MNLAYWAYKTIVAAAAAMFVPPWWLHQRLKGGDLRRVYQRIGFYPQGLRERLRSPAAVWLHAVSVGEVGAAASILSALQSIDPACRAALSSSTPTGLQRAAGLSTKELPVFYAPFDLDFSNRAALKMVKPKVLGLLETEIWPNLIIAAHRRGVRTAVVNGRISVRSIRNYRKIGSLIRHTLRHVTVFSMISDEDADRVARLGAPPDRIVVNGNAKFDSCAATADGAARQWATELFNVRPNMAVWVAGSTRHPEERVLLEAFAAMRRIFPNILLILAPRHTARVPQIEAWIREHGIEFQRRSQIDGRRRRRNAPVVILDTMGELSRNYSIADFVFCGGSLVPKGGQNLLEPAMWGKPVMHGPSMEDFADASNLLARSGATALVRDAGQIVSVGLDWLRAPAKARAIGTAGRQAIATHCGAAARHAAVLHQLLKTDSA